MASVKGILVVGVTIGAAFGVYTGLNKAFPKHVDKGEMPDIVASADDVFGKSISENQPLPAPKAPPPTAPPTQIAEGEPPPTSGTAATPAAPAETPKPAEPAATAAAPAPEPAKPAESPKPAEPAKPSSSSQQALLVPEPAPTPAPSASAPAKMPETAMPSGEKPAEAPKPTPKKSAPPPKPAEPAPKPAEPASKPAEPAPKPAPKPAEPAPKPAAPAKPAPSAPAATASNARWWGDPKEQDPRRLNLSYAGQSAGQKGIALLFTGTFASAGVANWIKVTDANGKAAPGHWELGASPKMLSFVGMPPGHYTVTLSPDLKDAQGKTLGRKLSGPVSVQ